MDFQNMKRRQLQSLCKLNNIPANQTNAAMATALSNLPTVEGLEEFLRDPTAGDFGSPDVSRTATRQKVTIEEPEGSTLTTRTRGTRRRAVEGADTRKTPATTRTTRKKASEEATAQKRAEKDLQADFETDLEQSEVTDNSELLEDVSADSMENEAQLSLESQNTTIAVVPEVVSDIHFDVADNNENVENNDDAIKDEEEPTEMYNSNRKVDFHSLSRRDLQGLCKKNKIPANTSNATMADALESLEIVEGLEEFLEEYNSQAPHSPTMSEMTSSCARRTWTSRRVSKEPASAKLITKSCRGSRRKVIEEIDQENTSAVSQTSEAGTIVCCVESVQKKELQTYSRRNTVASAAKPTENTERPGDVVSDEGSLSVVEAAEIGNPEVHDFVATSNENDYKQEAVAMNKFGESLQDVNTSEKDTKKGDYDILATENAKLLEDSENKKDAVIEHISIGVSENPEQLQNTVNDLVFSESKDSQLENGTNASDAGSENGSENSELQNVDEGESGESSEDSDVSSDEGSENGSENSEFENIDEGTNTGGLDSEIVTDTESKCEPIELCLVEKLEGAQSDKVLDKFVPELTTLADKVDKTETEKQLIDSVVVSSDIADQLCPGEQTENNHAEEERDTSEEAYSELTIQTMGEKTPLEKKSIRQLKKLIKEKIQEKKAFAKKLENLTLKDKEDSLAKVEEDQESEDLEGVRAEDLEDLIESIDVTLADNFDGDDLQANFDANAANLYPVDTILDNLISEDAITGNINVELDQEMASEKQSSITPSKMMKPLVSSPSKTPVSVARMNHAADINKENIDSATRTESNKISAAKSFLTMSIGKLKKELEGMQQRSEKKRTPLHTRSENCH
ncbi:hypothetical protein KSS87_011510 [Heliosperma pusillum]|nr:hypothetical protein KSS87_011510 [Heliosperma pusillum]